MCPDDFENITLYEPTDLDIDPRIIIGLLECGTIEPVKTDCAPSDVIAEALSLTLDSGWFFASTKYSPDQYGEQMMSSHLDLKQFDISPRGAMHSFKVQEYELSSEESWDGLELNEPVERSWVNIIKHSTAVYSR